MEPLELFESPDLLRFFRRHKTELSCLEQSYMLLGKMRDCDLIPEDRYKKVSRIQKSERKKKAIYELLDWFEKERAQHIRRFWTCILQETLLEQCPTLRRLHKSLMDGSYQFESELPESTPRAQPPGSEVTPVREKGKVKPLESKACEELSEAPSPARRSSAKLSSARKIKRSSSNSLGSHQRKLDSWVLWTQDQQPVSPASSPAKRHFCPSPSVLDTLQLETSPCVEGRLEPVPTGRAGHAQDQAVLGMFDFTRQRRPLVSSGNETPGKKKAKTKHLTAVDKEEESLTEKSKSREDERDIWTWPIYKSQLPVTCGHLQGKLHRKRLTKGLPCIFSHRRWYTPTEFEEAGGKKSCKNWKTSIRCESVVLDSLIKSGHLQCGSFRRWRQKRDVTLHSRAVFEVTCGTACGKLHKQRFASGSCGLSVRTEERWMTPEEFVTAALHVANPAWSRDILWEDRPLSLLVEVRRGLPSLSSQAICHDDNKPDKTRMQPMVVVFTRLSMDCALFQREVLRVHPSECFCVLCKPSAEDLESQRNDDSCCVCQSETEEQLVVCDQCPRAFHQWCHLPQVDDATLRDNKKWLCTFCIFKNSQDWCYSNESGRDKAELLGSAVSSYMMCQYLLLYLYTSDETHLLPGHKMELSRRLQSQQIQTIGEFESEVKSLFTHGRSTHQKVSGLQDAGKKQEALYNVLDRFAETKPQDIKLFWKCVLQETLLEQCPTLKRLQSKLMSESHCLAPTSTPAKKKEKTKHMASVADDEQPSLSSPPAQGGNTEASRFQPVKKSDSQTPANLTYPLPVTCGTLKGKLYKKKFEKGEASIFSNLHWYTPTQFVVAAGKSSKHWKSSIRYHSVTMDALIKDGHLQSGSSRSAQKKLQTKDASGEKPKGQLDSRAVFEVTCGAASGKLHKQRFASGSCGMSVRTETRWVTPEEFVKAAPHVANPAWSRDIQCEGRPLSLLVKRGILHVHPTGCCCGICKPSAEDLRRKRNDDKCCLCKADIGEQLVLCTQCPRAFHRLCHLPQVDHSMLRDHVDWLCTFCTFKRIQELHHRYESKKDKTQLLKSKISDYKMQCQYLLLYLYSSDETQVLPEYKTLLGRRLQNNQIQTIGEFDSEIRVLFIVSNSHYQGQTETLDTCQRLQQRFNRKFDEVFNVH
ncbi:uncharacterized protein LOC128751270 isoform X3 [Synchiropus splendidus]|uniref:uncharacterized protein LOC128751270 isoform X3 n=1 Tax=Synchiropus splendidus TaxID=270530 RepID=UPI00237DE312|nr:uncharacterized protein LOC128751270 isoform X3 [Synchiropus splendidus]